MEKVIAALLQSRDVAVAGVSRYPSKFGNRIYRFLVAAGYEVFAVNPNADCIDDAPCYPTLAEIPSVPESVVTVTQPWVTTGIVKQAIELGVRNVWMQPGSESVEAVQAATDAGIGLVYGGPCIMVEINRAGR